MNEKSPKENKTTDATQNAMRFLKRNPTSEGNKDENLAAKEKTGPYERVYTANSTPYDFRRPRVFDQMASDRFGEELAPDAAIWNIYLEEAQDRDRELVEGRQRSLDTLLLFAALFSAILTAFLIESKDLLQQDPADASVALLLIIAQSQQRMELGLPTPEESTRVVTMPDFIPSLSARWINGIWFMSLGLSLSAALIAMLGKEWLTTFQSSRPRSSRRLAYIRQSRLKGLEDWGVLHIVALLPTLLHVSLLLFSIGLVLYLWALDVAVASVLSVVIGVTLTFYLVTGILGAVYEFCPFVTEVSEYTKRALTALFKPSTKDTNNETLGASIRDLNALAWLSERSTDPIVVDYAYQAMAGLHRSPYITLSTPAPVLNLDLTPTLPEKLSTLDNDVTIDSLLLHISGRFDELLSGMLETDSSEPPVCRYINAMIALLSYAAKSPNEMSMDWPDLLNRITRFWSSKLPQASITGGSFAGVLIAQMDIIKLAADGLKLATTKNDSLLQETESLSSRDRDQHIIDVPSSTTRIDAHTIDIIIRLNTCLAQWIDISLALLQSYVEGETNIDSYLLNGLLRALSDGASYLEFFYEFLADRGTAETGDDPLKSLKILISLLSQPTSSGLDPVAHHAKILKIYSHIVPVKLQELKRGRTGVVRHDFKSYLVNSYTLTTRREILCLSAHYMLLTASYLCGLLSESPKCWEIFSDALGLQHQGYCEDLDAYEGPCGVVRNHIGDYIKILEVFSEKQSNVELMTEKTASMLCIFAYAPQPEFIPTSGLYISPSCFLSLMRLFAHSDLDTKAAQDYMRFAMTRLKSPDVSLSQLASQTSPFPDPRPSIEYLWQFTCISGGFSALLQAGSISTHFSQAVVPGVANITIIAANHDAALKVEPVELEPPVVPDFLEALSWTLPKLSSSDDKKLYHRFILASSVLLVDDITAGTTGR
ncbi:unnamed protein product [Rhizoctonia solani]|uniref:DUF6535 domain-containing protein n=1 Tax=Rhizoctonia solani TaxID=456999 RepID=A0A8H3C1X6_9AGAM|nr:unnamed protein product [Rhizoctonia solani]